MGLISRDRRQVEVVKKQSSSSVDVGYAVKLSYC